VAETNDVIAIADLNGKYLSVLIKVQIKSLKEPMPEHPNPARQEPDPNSQDSYFLVDYIGRCAGVREVDGVESLVIDLTVGERNRVSIPLENVNDISFYVPPTPPNFPVSGLQRMPTGKVS